MKCIYCNADSKRKERQVGGGRCPTCQHLFAFEPQTDPLTLTDTRFQRAIKDGSGDGGVLGAGLLAPWLLPIGILGAACSAAISYRAGRSMPLPLRVSFENF